MQATAVRVLTVGRVGPHLSALLERLARKGWGSYPAETYAEARIVLRTLRFDVILAPEFLVDASGFDLSNEVGSRAASLFVDVSLSEGHLWLPVVERGTRTLGERALYPVEFEQEIGVLLSRRVASRFSTGSVAGARSRAESESDFNLALASDSEDRMAFAAGSSATIRTKGKRKS
jgi:hypothetical protein